MKLTEKYKYQIHTLKTENISVTSPQWTNKISLSHIPPTPTNTSNLVSIHGLICFVGNMRPR